MNEPIPYSYTHVKLNKGFHKTNYIIITDIYKHEKLIYRFRAQQVLSYYYLLSKRQCVCNKKKAQFQFQFQKQKLCEQDTPQTA
jgi:hypothetical protein